MTSAKLRQNMFGLWFILIIFFEDDHGIVCCHLRKNIL